MPTIIINDETVDVKVGEKLLSAARDNASHIGFVCDGRGLCKTCTVRVLAGSDKLGAPTDMELEALSEAMRQDGYRLGCQATVQGDGVKVISRAEELRRHAISSIPIIGQKEPSGDSTGSLLSSVGNVAMDYVTSVPYILSHVVPRFQAMPLKLNKVQTVLNDAGRVIQRALSTTKKTK